MTARPNVLLVMTDQQRWDSLSSAGGAVETANIDHLAAQGTMFTSAYSATPSCTPARASLLTGMDPWHTGVLGMGGGQPPLAGLSNTLPEVLGAAGYQTQGVGKMHHTPHRARYGFHETVIDESLRKEDPGFRSDYTEWFEQHAPSGMRQADHGLDFNSWLARPFHAPEELHPSTWTVTESIRFLERRDPTRPFFLMTSFARPHSPYDPPAFYYEHYLHRHRAGELPAAAVGGWAAIHDVGGAEAADPNAWHGRRTPDQIGRARAGYYGSIHHIDHQIGRLLRHLRDTRLDTETLVVFTSDHGDMLGDHHLWRKTYAYEGSAHIPLVLRLPAGMRSASDAQVVSAPTCLQDVMPTILDACGVAAPSSVDGASLLPLVRADGHERPEWRTFVHGEHAACYDESQEMHYLTDGEWKYIWFPRADLSVAPAEQLFDLRSDPLELHDLVRRPDQAAQLQRWRGQLVEVLRRRDAGLTDGQTLVSQRGRPPLRSPHAADRHA